VGRKAADLNALAVSRIDETGMHAVGTVAGLYLQVLQSGARTWILRSTIGGKRRDMGLGGYPGVTLAQAWQKARKARDKIEDGVDPIEERRANRRALKAAQASARTFKQCAAAYMDAHSPGWRHSKHTDQWRSSLQTYAYPVIGDMRVRDVELPHVLRILEPIWHAKTETASRLRGRIERVLDWAIAGGYRTGLNPPAGAGTWIRCSQRRASSLRTNTFELRVAFFTIGVPPYPYASNVARKPAELTRPTALAEQRSQVVQCCTGAPFA